MCSHVRAVSDASRRVRTYGPPVYTSVARRACGVGAVACPVDVSEACYYIIALLISYMAKLGLVVFWDPYGYAGVVQP